MSDELTSARDAYLSHFSHATDDSSKSVIMKAITDNIQRSLPHGEHRTFARSDDQQSTDKIRFIQEYLRSIGYRPTVVQLDPHTGNGVVRFEPQASTAPAPQTSQSSQAPRRRRQRQDPIADAIGGLGQAVAASGSNSQWQQNVTQTSGQLTNSVADAVAERVAAPLTNAIRRSVSSSRSSQATSPQGTPAVLTSGNVMPGATFRPFQPNGEVPDLNNPQRWQDSPQTDIRTASQSRSAPTPNWNPSTATLAQRAAANAEHARQIVADIAGTGGGGGAGIPPIPPGGGQPPGPPDEPEDDDSILNRLLEFFQRMFGVRPDIANRSFLDTLANNLTSILGGVIPPPGADGQRPAAIATLMDTFADYFNVPRETEDATREAQDNLRRSIDRLTEATNGASNGGTPSQPQTRWQRFRGFFRRGRTRRGGIATATRLASFVRPVLTRIGNLVPQRFRNSAAQMGQNIIGGMAQRYGVSAATAARFGAALGPAVAGLAVLRVGLPILGAGISFAAKGLKHLSDEAMKTTMSLVRYSGALAASNAHLEVGRQLRNFEIAQNIQGHGASRIELQNKIEEEWVPITSAMTNIGNQLGIVYDNIVLIGLKFANKLGELQVSKEEAFNDFNQALRDAMNEDRKAKGLPPLKPNEGPQANAGGNNNGVMFAGREAVFGQNAPDMVDFNRRQRGPRRPVNGGN